MPLWMTVSEWFARNASQLSSVTIEPEGGAAEIRPQQSYVRVWLEDAFLERDRAWFTDRYPAVHASIRLRNSTQDTLQMTTLARPPEGMLGRTARRRHDLTPLLPYYGGVVELEAGLTALQGNNLLAASLDVLQDVAGLVGPPIASGVAVAGKVADGVQRLIDAGAGMELGLHETFAAAGSGANALRSCHLAVLNAPAATFGEGDLEVVDGRLHRAGDAAPLEGHDYMLFFVEGRDDRDDWRNRELDELLSSATQRFFAGDTDGYQAFRSAALAKAYTSPDFTVPDRKRIALRIREELDGIEGEGRGAAPGPTPTLASIARTALPLEEARLLPDAGFADLVATAGGG